MRVPADQAARFIEAVAIIADVLSAIDALPVLPGEVEDILAITPRERRRWTREGRLIIAGTRTIRFCGKGKLVTFDVFDPCHIEDFLDRGLADLWRDEDRMAAAGFQRRRRTPGKRVILDGGAMAATRADAR